MDFLAAVGKKTCEITLAGKTILVEQQTLLGHYKLKALTAIIIKLEPSHEKVEAVFEYIRIATGIEDLSDVGLNEIVSALDSLVLINSEIAELAWQHTTHSENDKSRTTSDYDHRELAIIVNMLAKAYGWSTKQIFSLNPEAAICYVQEILLDDWKREEFEYQLSEVAYDAKGKYKAFSPLPWYTVVRGPTIEEATTKIPRKYLPAGVVLDVRKKHQRLPDSSGSL